MHADRNNLRDAARRSWANPETRARRIAAIRAAWRDPETRERHDLLSEEQIQQMIAQLRRGDTLAKAARDWMISINAAGKYARDRGVTFSRGRPRRQP